MKAEKGRIVLMRFGSHIYGTNTPESDSDFKAIHLPSASDVLLSRAKETIVTSTKSDGSVRNGAEDTDFESFSLRQYLKLLLQGQTVALDMFFCPDEHILESGALWAELRSMKDKWLHKGVSAFAGYCKQQANKYGIKGSRIATCRDVVSLLNACDGSAKLHDIWGSLLSLEGMDHIEFVAEDMRGKAGVPVRMISVCGKKAQENVTVKEAMAIYKAMLDNYGLRAKQAECNEGVDWKALMHAVRVCGQAEELLATAHITFPRPNAAELLLIRKGETPYQAVAETIEAGLERLETAKAASSLPETPDYEAADEFVIKAYREVIIRGGSDV